MKFPVHLARVAAVFSTVAAFSMASTFVEASAAQASSNESTAATGTVDRPTAQKKRVFVIQPDGTSVEVPPGTDLRAVNGSATVPPFYSIEWQFSGLDDCFQRFEVCFWSEDHYDRHFIRMGGDYAPCEGFRFEGTVWQDHVYSIWSRASGPISLWNRFSDGSYRYHKYALVQPNYSHDTQFTKIIDAWVHDPNNNCTSLKLHRVTY